MKNAFIEILKAVVRQLISFAQCKIEENMDKKKKISCGVRPFLPKEYFPFDRFPFDV